jgi:TfoX/Sxy family transcriptional regulator of competence genes
MAYDPELAARVLSALADHPSLRPSQISEKKMFGGLSYMVGDAMAIGVLEERLVVRTTPERAEELLEEPHVRPMDFTGKPMKGWLYVDSPAVSTGASMRRWVDLAMDFVLNHRSTKKTAAKKTAVKKTAAKKTAVKKTR